MRISDWSSDVCSSDLLDAVAKQRLHRIGIEAALQLFPALKDDLVLRQLAALIIEHTCLGRIPREVEAIDIAGYLESGVDDLHRLGRVPRQCTVGLRFLPAKRYLGVAFLI